MLGSRADQGEFDRNHIDAAPKDAYVDERVKEAAHQFERGLPSWPDASVSQDLQMHIARHTKALTELPRNDVAQVREIQYDLEHRLAQFSSKGHPTSSNTPIVASLMELNIICGRAADEVREAVREGPWFHLSD